MPDTRSNLSNKTYGNRELAGFENLVADKPKPCAKIIIGHPEKRFAKTKDRVLKLLELANAINIEKNFQIMTTAASLNATSM